MEATNKRGRGSLYIVIAAFFFGTYGIWSKMMSGVFDDFFQSWTRSLIVVVVMIPIGIIFKKLKKIEKKDIKWYLAYSLPGAITVPTMFYAYTQLSVGTVLILFYSMLTISTYVYGIIFFKEKMTPVKIISLILGIAGLIATYSLNFKEGIFPMIITIISGICAGTESVFTKKLSDKYSDIQLTIGVYLVCFILTFVCFLLINKFSFNIQSTAEAWIGNIGHAIVGILSFLFMVKGYELLEPSIAGIIGLLEIPVGIVLALIIFGEAIGISTIIGGGLIIVASMLPNLVDIFKNKSKKAEIV